MSVGRHLIAALLVIAGPGSALAGACRTDIVDLSGDWGHAQFRVELADDAEERAQGLMHREAMPRGSGMLFVYPRPQPVAFWMRNTLIPLDMIFMDETGTVTALHQNAQPGDETPVPGGTEVRFVLEINGGMAHMLGLKPGTRMRHPAVPQEIAAWPC